MCIYTNWATKLRDFNFTAKHSSAFIAFSCKRKTYTTVKCTSMVALYCFPSVCV